MTWEELSELKHKLQALESDIFEIKRRVGQALFDVESAILKKKD